MAKTSRKTKKTWVKNINLQDIEESLEANREKEILFGENEDQEFVIDETGDKNKKVKQLKSSEILTNKSKVSGLIIERNKRPSAKKVKKLMEIAGRVDSSTSMALIDRDGLTNVDNIDIWDQGTDIKSIPNHKKVLPEYANNKDQEFKPPRTLKRKPIELDFESRELHPGKSYNPSLESWKQLIDEEFGIEKDKEMNRQVLIQRQEMLNRMLAEEESSDEDGDDQEEEHEVYHDITEDRHKLSINKPTVNKKKTKTQRNKQLRHAKRVELETRLKQLKLQITQLSKLDEINEQVKSVVPKSNKLAKKPKKLFKYNIRETPIEVKLSNELNSNLKNLKSEGNLFYSNLLNLETKGLIETRVPVAKKSKYKPKITEKWSYKDFK